MFKKTEFNVYKDDLVFFRDLLKTEPSENKIIFKNSNIFLKDSFDETLFINKIKKSSPDIKQLAIVGGVAINNYLRTGLEKVCKQNNIELISPPKNMFGDNAAMIAWACIKKLQKGDFKENIYFKADPRLQITQKINEILVS